MYRTASLLGDVEAISSGRPNVIAKRMVRKSVYRRQGATTRRLLRWLGL